MKNAKTTMTTERNPLNNGKYFTKSVAYDKPNVRVDNKMKLPKEYQYNSWDEVDWKGIIISLSVLGFMIYGIYSLVIR